MGNHTLGFVVSEDQRTAMWKWQLEAERLVRSTEGSCGQAGVAMGAGGHGTGQAVEVETMRRWRNKRKKESGMRFPLGCPDG